MSSTREERAAKWSSRWEGNPPRRSKISPVASQRRGGREVREGMHDLIDVHFRERSVNPLWN
jgi:hypothetical protein